MRVPMPENRMETLGSNPISSGASTVAPNIATTCCMPTTTVCPIGSRSSGRMIPSVFSFQPDKNPSVSAAVLAAGIENRESCFFNRFGQLIYREDRGKFAGYDHPEVGIHRGRLHMILYRAVLDRLGGDRVRTNHHCVGIEQDELGVRI